MNSNPITADVHLQDEINASVSAAAWLGCVDDSRGVATVDWGQVPFITGQLTTSYELGVESGDEDEVDFEQIAALDIPLASWQGKMRMRSWTKGEPHKAFMDTVDVLLSLEE